MSTSIAKQISIYFIAIFFPFLSIVPGMRYVGQPDSKSKVVGVVILLLTGISILVNVYAIIYLWGYLGKLYKDPLSIGDLPINIDNEMLDSLKNLQ